MNPIMARDPLRADVWNVIDADTRQCYLTGEGYQVASNVLWHLQHASLPECAHREPAECREVAESITRILGNRYSGPVAM